MLECCIVPAQMPQSSLTPQPVRALSDEHVVGASRAIAVATPCDIHDTVLPASFTQSCGHVGSRDGAAAEGLNRTHTGVHDGSQGKAAPAAACLHSLLPPPCIVVGDAPIAGALERRSQTAKDLRGAAQFYSRWLQRRNALYICMDMTMVQHRAAAGMQLFLHSHSPTQVLQLHEII